MVTMAFSVLIPSGEGIDVGVVEKGLLPITPREPLREQGKVEFGFKRLRFGMCYLVADPHVLVSNERWGLMGLRGGGQVSIQHAETDAGHCNQEGQLAPQLPAICNR